MYKISVPIMLKTLSRYGAEEYIEKLKEINAERVFLATDSYIADEDKRKEMLDCLSKYVQIFQNAGFEVGVWLWAFMMLENNKYTHITSPSGAVSGSQVCPSEEDFRRFASKYIAEIAKCSPDLIMFDDDYRYGFLDCGLGCACKNHKKYMSELLGEELPTENLGEIVFGGSKNKYRSAFLKANAHYLQLFAKEIRKAVDSVNPTIRLGLCSCMDVWDHCGISADEISIVLAGKTTPFLRLIGAPYWSTNKGWGNRLQDVIELERMERSWCKDGIEIFSEGDSYPRPRFTCSASRLECFDLALRATGNMDGILKYIFDYYSSAGYEDGYFKAGVKNAGLYKDIEKVFANKNAVGVRVYEFKNKFENMTVPEKWSGKDDVQNSFFSPAARLMAACSTPTVYDGNSYGGIVFGENAKYLVEGDYKNGLIIDIRAAEILESKGVDVGLKSVGDSFNATEEFFVKQGEYVNLNNSEVATVEVKNGAKVESYNFSGDRKEIGSYIYENKDDLRFLVLCFDGYFANDHSVKQYARQRQLTESVEWLCGKKMPIALYGNPDVYTVCKKDEKSTSVFIGNFFEDVIDNLEIDLGEEFYSAEFINCEGKINKNKVVINKVLPFTCVAFEVKK